MATASLSDYAIREIAMRCGNGWRRVKRLAVADCLDWQRARIENYCRVMDIAHAYVRDRDGMTKETRDAIWTHVCAETDILWKATN